MGGCKEKGHPLAFFKEKQEVFTKWEVEKDVQGNVTPPNTHSHTHLHAFMHAHMHAAACIHTDTRAHAHTPCICSYYPECRLKVSQPGRVLKRACLGFEVRWFFLAVLLTISMTLHLLFNFFDSRFH